jgi:2-polyprenyl-3-methyl-5-hydroxy-6-metoxy-1,4-benzoquinol methylase
MFPVMPDTCRLLVAIANYGYSNDRYMARLVREYRSMSLDVDIVVLSNIEKNVVEGVELVIGLPSKDPWSLPFAHKQIFADRLNDYDLFLYSEDDTLVTERNIRAFLRATDFVHEDEIPGFLRFEEDPSGRNYPEIHGHFHWDTTSVRSRGEYVAAFCTNEHAACYLLTRAQLKRAIDSGGYLVEPHRGKYDLLCSAATDPYTQCGLQKLICVSHVDDFLVHHLPNKYVGSRFGIREEEFRRQIRVLLKMGRNGDRPASLFSTETKLIDGLYSKDYYELPRPELESIIPSSVRTVLSIGCGWGATEAWLAEKGFEVTAVPLDPLIPGGAASAGVEIACADFATARRELANRKFDCLLLMNVLHLVDDPVALLTSFKELLSETSIIVSLVPNMASLQGRRTRAELRQPLAGISSELSGANFVSHKVVRKWFYAAGAKLRKTINILPPRAQDLSKVTLGLADAFLSSEFFSIAQVK